MRFVPCFRASRQLTYGSLVMAVITGVSWLGRHRMAGALERHPALLAAVFAGAAAWVVAIVGFLRASHRARARRWRRRTRVVTGLERLSAPSQLAGWLLRLPDPLEWASGPLLKTKGGQRLTEDWRQAGFGGKGSRYLLTLAISACASGLLGWRLGGPILGIGLGLSVPLLPLRFVRNRSEKRKRRSGEQAPAALDAIASGLSAGLSFDGAVRFAAEEVPDPMGEALGQLGRMLDLGVPFDQSVGRWLREHPLPTLAMAMDGVMLQHQLGGDMIRMLAETADTVRARLELEREIHAVTAQGRLSGWVIAALVPVSVGMLLSLNPRYIDVLFDSLIGQMLLVVALALQLIGWSVISRLIRVEV
jgi:tight adherence protein B